MPSLKMSCVLREELRSLNFGRPAPAESHFGIPKFCQILCFLYIYLLKRLQSLTLEGPLRRETPIVASPIFARFSLFLISTHSENLIHLAVTV